MFNSNELIGTYLLIIYVGAMSVVFSMAAAIEIPEERYKHMGDENNAISEVYLTAVVVFGRLARVLHELTQSLHLRSTESPLSYEALGSGGVTDIVNYLSQGLSSETTGFGIIDLSRGISHFSTNYLICGMLLLLALCCVLTILGLVTLTSSRAKGIQT